VFEVLSPGNTGSEMMDKLAFYEEYGVEEYYIYDPDSNSLFGYTRRGDVLLRVRKLDGFVSPRLGIRFDLSGPELVVRYPDGRPFRTFEELDVERAQAMRQAADAQERVEQARHQAAEAQQRAEQAEQRAEQREKRAESAEQRVARLTELTRKALQ